MGNARVITGRITWKGWKGVGKGWEVRGPGDRGWDRVGEKIALGPCIVIRNRMELCDEDEFITLPALDQMGVHVAHRRIIHLTTGLGQRVQKSETRDRELLHDRLVQSYSAVIEIGANNRSYNTTHSLEVLLPAQTLVRVDSKKYRYDIQQILVERVTERAQSNSAGDELAIFRSGRESLD